MSHPKVAPETMSETPSHSPEIEVFAVHGADPEVLAYAMAKYSRSALSMKESLKELNEQKAEKFLNTFYFQYGHRSIADLAHVAMAIEKLSLLAAIALVDEQRWDGQERSTRYQDYKKASYYVPNFGEDLDALHQYRAEIDALFAAYELVSEDVFRYLCSITPRPEDMKQEAYDRTLRARAFDVSRYLLPLATNTSLGQIVNARTLENQVSRLLSDEHQEIRHLGDLLKNAAKGPAWNVNDARVRSLIEGAKDQEFADKARGVLLRDVRVSPTLVKYAEPNSYQMETRQALRQAAAELMKNAAIEKAPLVDLLEDEPLEIELATTLLYEHCHYSYRQLRTTVESLSAARRDEIVALGTAHRGRHDELLRAFCVGQKFRFDILQDIGGFRDMHRHRRCTQIGQGFTTAHGYDTPEEVIAAGAQRTYDDAMQRAAAASRKYAGTEPAEYVIPLAYRKRTLFKMDFAEVVYISELRTKPEGHISYRRVSYAMYEAVAKRYPALAGMFRVKDISEPVDLLKR
ncbi:MAG TPA: FAD-dependent thymidylate synthase [Terriglobales bacterium]|nr:FAD-dependent thymidylate synthase [Terriglobales bacterium]